MSFLNPKPPKPIPPPSIATQAVAEEAAPAAANAAPMGLITTSPQGLTKKPRTIKPSLVGGASGN